MRVRTDSLRFVAGPHGSLSYTGKKLKEIKFYIETEVLTQNQLTFFRFASNLRRNRTLDAKKKHAASEGKSERQKQMFALSRSLRPSSSAVKSVTRNPQAPTL